MLVRLKRITSFLASERDLYSALQFVAQNACPSGKPSRLLFSRIKSDLTLVHIFSFGLEASPSSHPKIIDFFHSLTRKEGSLTNSIVVIEHDDLFQSAFHSEMGFEDDRSFSNTILIPIFPHFTFMISIRKKMGYSRNSYVDYFETLRAALNLYLLLQTELNKRAPRSKRSRLVAMGNQLTERQELILEMIREGMTNISIAKRIGYSESLVRQESMLIYEKMGVVGRKGLLEKKV